MKQNRVKTLSLWLGSAVVGATSAAAADVPVVRILKADPLCVEERLGRVRVTLGEEQPDPRRGGQVAGVSYKKALAKLQAAAAERGGDAVILREHQADYFSKGSRPSRPTYISLSGAAVRLRDAGTHCALAEINPDDFERSELARDRTSVSKNAGVNF